MKTISIALASHLAGRTTTMATCWKATLTNGTIYGFTDAVNDIVYAGVTYLARAGFTPSAVTGNSDLAVDNLDLVGVFDSDVITDADIAAGLWDYADIRIFQVNYADLTMGDLKMARGTTGQIQSGRLQFTAELRGLTQLLQQDIGKLYSATCRADLGDAQCKVSLVPITVTGAVSSVTNNRTFVDSSRSEPDGKFEGGLVTWTSGPNDGLQMEVKSYIAKTFTLQLPMPYAVTAADTYTVYPGCLKRMTEDCKTKFNNVVNFRGEPWVPGIDALLKAAGT